MDVQRLFLNAQKPEPDNLVMGISVNLLPGLTLVAPAFSASAII